MDTNAEVNKDGDADTVWDYDAGHIALALLCFAT